MKKQYIIPIFVPHLGCPNDCVFCNQKSISGQTKQVTKEDVKKIIGEGESTSVLLDLEQDQVQDRGVGIGAKYKKRTIQKNICRAF